MVDPDIAAWILEFLFRQRDVSLRLAVELFLALPLPSPLPPRLSAALLFHRLSADVSSRSVSLRTLDTLSFIHRLYPSPSLLPAFAAVAVECTVAPLRERTLSSSSTDSDAEFFDAVNKIWNFRMDDLERSESAGLVSPALREARKEMETAVVDPALREELARRETKEAALNALRVCLAAAGNEVGPTFLESAAEAIISRDCEDMAGNNIDRSLAALGDKMRTLYSSWSEPVETGKEVLITPSKTDTSRTTVPVELVDRSKNIKLTGPNVEDHQMGASATMTGQRKENLDDKNCNNELRSGQLEPLRSDPEDVVQKHKNVLADKASRPAKTSVSCSSLDANIASNLDIAKTKRPSLMERNATAHTFEWDSPTSQYEQSSNPTRKVNNSSSRKTSSALDETGEFILRRRKRKWNLLEEETLRKAVAELCSVGGSLQLNIALMYGVGNWKFIKSRHLDIFKSRTEVDLKDKWRNMTRYS